MNICDKLLEKVPFRLSSWRCGDTEPRQYRVSIKWQKFSHGWVIHTSGNFYEALVRVVSEGKMEKLEIDPVARVLLDAANMGFHLAVERSASVGYRVTIHRGFRDNHIAEDQDFYKAVDKACRSALGNLSPPPIDWSFRDKPEASEQDCPLYLFAKRLIC